MLVPIVFTLKSCELAIEIVVSGLDASPPGARMVYPKLLYQATVPSLVLDPTLTTPMQFAGNVLFIDLSP